MTSTKKIQNPKTQLSKKSAVNDSDLLSSALATEKNMCNSYAIAMPEASNSKFYSSLFDMMKETSQQHRKLYDLQFQHGWCSLTPAQSSEVAALYQEYIEYKQQLK
ncbi:spore coat protein [Sporosarcina sp. FSL K6-6792]|uniref:spore coat protein n=1 Tax=Sporosarcina sp. FSL K6-6792 TaxID=2921559 RepID=UPI0030F85BC7